MMAVSLRVKLTRRLLTMAASIFIYYYFQFKTSLTNELMPSSGRLKEEIRPGRASTIKLQLQHFNDFSNLSYPSGPSYHGRIAFRLHNLDDMAVNPPGIYAPLSCEDNADLTSTLAHKGVLDFKVSVSKDLNMIFIGDSIASQLAQAFDSAALEPHYDYESNSVKHTFSYMSNSKHICATQSTIRGGGGTAYMRNNGILSSNSMIRRHQCKQGSTLWGTDLVASFLDNHHPIDEQPRRNVGRSFNAAILKIPALGWIKDIRSVTKERIMEAINLAGKIFGAETVIISTLTFSNNVQTISDWVGIRRVNDMIRQIARNWDFSQRNDLSSVRWILVQEFGNFTNQMIWTNAKHIGYDVDLNFSVNGWEGVNTDFLLDRFEQVSKFHFSHSKAMVCAERPSGTNEQSCEYNKISPDGMHWCSPTLGPRYSASVACLLGCVYNGELGYLVERETSNITNKSVRVCEDECNQRFMSLVPVDNEWIDGGVTLYSRPT
mmetsp:Transcript_11798/g.19494  ORF Transcript_11798/g.19494 Transcript_11798/m.19494 type:complete len:491 (-) Transcript_11798:92-1564(-)